MEDLNTQARMKPVKPVRKGKYASVEDMVRDVADDTNFVEDTVAKLRERAVIDMLMGLRTAKGLNQQDIAERMNCTQSRISKLENGKDEDLRVGDVHEFLDAVGLDLSFFVTRKGSTLTDRIKIHTFAIRRLLNRLCDISKGDKSMTDGVKSFGMQVLLNNAISVGAALERLESELESAERNHFIPELPAETPPVIIDGVSEPSDNRHCQAPTLFSP